MSISGYFLIKCIVNPPESILHLQIDTTSSLQRDPCQLGLSLLISVFLKRLRSELPGLKPVPFSFLSFFHVLPPPTLPRSVLQRCQCPSTESPRWPTPSRSPSQWCRTAARRPPVSPRRAAAEPERMSPSASSHPSGRPCCWPSAPSATSTLLSSSPKMVGTAFIVL